MIKNLTPHDVTIVVGNEVKVFKKSETPARMTTKNVPNGTIDGIPIVKTVFGEPVDLPNPEVGTFLIVSQIIKSALPTRKDLLVPAEIIRDTTGAITGCRSLQQ